MDATMPDRGLPLSLWGIWWNAMLIRTGDRLAVPTLDEALARLDCVWSDFFREPAA